MWKLIFVTVIYLQGSMYSEVSDQTPPPYSTFIGCQDKADSLNKRLYDYAWGGKVYVCVDTEEKDYSK